VDWKCECPSGGTLNLHHKAVGLSSTRFAVKRAVIEFWSVFLPSFPVAGQYRMALSPIMMAAGLQRTYDCTMVLHLANSMGTTYSPAEWTLDGELRQTTFLGWRDDKNAELVTRNPQPVTSYHHDHPVPMNRAM
jgi:hypothetical protein